MGKSYGFIEITGVVAAINALDIMCKTADVDSPHSGQNSWYWP